MEVKPISACLWGGMLIPAIRAMGVLFYVISCVDFALTIALTIAFSASINKDLV
jgi:hypothetical protein